MNETSFRPVEAADLPVFLRSYLQCHDPEYPVQADVGLGENPSLA